MSALHDNYKAQGEHETKPSALLALRPRAECFISCNAFTILKNF